MTGDQRTMLRNCLEQPTADDARLVFADALRESGDAQLEVFGRFVWAGVTLARYRGHEPAEEGWFFDAIGERDATAKAVCEWVSSGLGWGEWPCGWDTDAECPDRVTYSLIPQRNGRGPARSRYADHHRRQLVFERGMLHALRLPLAELLEHAESALHAWPVQRFEPLDIPGVTIYFEQVFDATRPGIKSHYGWAVSARQHIKATRGTLNGVPVQFGATDIVTPIFGLDHHDVTATVRDGLVRRVRRAMGLQLIQLRTMSNDRWPRSATADIYADFEELRPEEAT